MEVNLDNLIIRNATINDTIQKFEKKHEKWR